LSEPQSIAGIRPVAGLRPAAPARSDVRAAIARAAQATGVDFDYLLAQAKLESSLDPAARAPTSSAAGLYQFTNGTWLQTLERHGASHGMNWAGAMIDGGRVTDPAMRAQIMAMRYDADASSLMAAELANDNKAELTALLGREPDAAELYLAHFLGTAGSREFLTALNTAPGQSAASILPKAAAANRSIFYDRAGEPRSVAGVMELLRGRVSAAMDGGALPPATYDASRFAGAQAQPQISGGPIARQFAAARQDMTGTIPAGRSMADTLRTAFAVADGSGQASVPANIRAAYGQLQKFGM
jgi:hypothetical protein